MSSPELSAISFQLSAFVCVYTDSFRFDAQAATEAKAES
jgi:hypothetical protein